jgi:hypothetical protein
MQIKIQRAERIHWKIAAAKIARERVRPTRGKICICIEE